MAVIHTNCHGTALRKFLEGNRDFMRQYCIYPTLKLGEPYNCEIVKFSDEFLSNIQLIFYQDRRLEANSNCYLSMEFLKGKLTAECKLFCIPNFVSLGKGIHQSTVGPFEEGDSYRFHKDALLEEAYMSKKNITLEEILCYVKQYREPKAEIQEKWDECFERILVKEKAWDITISDYIRENYQKIPLFGDWSHPTRALWNEVQRRIAKELGLTVEESEFLNSYLGWFECFVWDYVREGLELEWENPREVRKTLVESRGEGKTGYDLREYITYYMYAWHDYVIK